MASPAPALLRRLLRGLALMRPAGARGRAWMLHQAREWRGRYAGLVASPLSVREGGIAATRIADHLSRLEGVLEPWFDRFESRDFLTQMTLVDIETYLPGDILTKVDRMSMAVSLEARVPFLDHPVVEFASSLPPGLKLRDGTGKWILREAIAGLVPPSVLSKPKQGFAVPLDHWFRGALRHRIDALHRADSGIAQWVDQQAVRRISTEHLSGQRDHQQMIWRLVALDGWMRALTARSLASPPAVHELLRARSGRVAAGSSAGTSSD